MKKQFISGQATMELAVMLIGFTTLLLGLIFTFGLEIANNQILLDAKFHTETYTNSEGEKTVANGSEISSWKYSKFNGAEVPFLLSDEQESSGSSSTDNFYQAITDKSRSSSKEFTWTSPRGFSESSIDSDFATDSLFDNAYSAAELVCRTADVDTYNPLLSGHSTDTASLNTLSEAFERWFGIRLNKNTLENNPTNRVYMPANGEK